MTDGMCLVLGGRWRLWPRRHCGWWRSWVWSLVYDNFQVWNL